MAITVDRGSSQHAEATASPLGAGTITNCTFACFYRPSSIANGTALSIGDTNSGEYFALGMNADGQAFFEVQGGNAATTGTLANGTWAHIAGVQTGNDNRVAYLNGAVSTANTDAKPNLSGHDSTTVGGLMLNGTRLSFAGGDIAECAIWNVALTAGEIAELAAGVSPLKVRPQSLVFYAPLTKGATPEQDLKGGLALTFGAAGAAPTKAATHPRIFLPAGALPVTITTAAGGGTPHTQAVNDAIQGTDNVSTSSSGALTHAVNDSISGTDTVAKAVTVAQADTAEVTDTGFVKAVDHAVQDTAVLSDSVDTGGSTAHTQAVNDSISGTDTVAKAAAHPLADTITGTDGSGRTVTKTVADTITGADVLTRAWDAIRTQADTAVLADLVSSPDFQGPPTTHPGTGGAVAELVRGGVIVTYTRGGTFTAKTRGGTVTAKARGGTPDEPSRSGTVPEPVRGGTHDESPTGGVVL